MKKLTVQVTESEDVSDIEHYRISKQCPNTNPIPLRLSEEPARFQNFNS